MLKFYVLIMTNVWHLFTEHKGKEITDKYCGRHWKMAAAAFKNQLIFALNSCCIRPFVMVLWNSRMMFLTTNLLFTFYNFFHYNIVSSVAHYMRCQFYLTSSVSAFRSISLLLLQHLVTQACLTSRINCSITGYVIWRLVLNALTVHLTVLLTCKS